MNDACYLCGAIGDGGEYRRVRLPYEPKTFETGALPMVGIACYKGIKICNRCLMLAKLEEDKNSLAKRIQEKSCQKI